MTPPDAQGGTDAPPPDFHVDARARGRAWCRRSIPISTGPLTLIANGWDNAIFRLGDDLAVRLPRRVLAVAAHRTRAALAARTGRSAAGRGADPGAHRPAGTRARATTCRGASCRGCPDASRPGSRSGSATSRPRALAGFVAALARAGPARRAAERVSRRAARAPRRRDACSVRRRANAGCLAAGAALGAGARGARVDGTEALGARRPASGEPAARDIRSPLGGHRLRRPDRRRPRHGSRDRVADLQPGGPAGVPGRGRGTHGRRRRDLGAGARVGARDRERGGRGDRHDEPARAGRRSTCSTSSSPTDPTVGAASAWHALQLVLDRRPSGASSPRRSHGRHRGRRHGGRLGGMDDIDRFLALATGRTVTADRVADAVRLRGRLRALRDEVEQTLPGLVPRATGGWRVDRRRPVRRTTRRAAVPVRRGARRARRGRGAARRAHPAHASRARRARRRGAPVGDGLTISGGGETAVATDELFVDAARLGAAAAGDRRVGGERGDAGG